MKEISTLSSLLKKSAQDKRKKKENNLHLRDKIQPREESIRMILSYSRSLKSVKTSLIGHVLVVNN